MEEKHMSDMIRQVPSLEPNEWQKKQMERQFGMFIHFGVNTFGNVEWSRGDIPALSFKPTAIDADQWVRTAYEAGMNYVVLITKHHDGFCLWHTDTTKYSVKYSGNTTDIVAEVARACKKYGMALGLYYSLWDCTAPEYKEENFDTQYVPYMLKHLTELMDGRYGEIVELWLDGAWEKPRSKWGLDQIYDTVKRLQPGCQIGVNHTVGIDNDLAMFPEKRYLPENYQENDPLRMYPSDFRLWDPNMCRTDDPKIYTYGGEEYYLPFEMTICAREGFSWFYSNIYEDKPSMNAAEVAEKCRILFETNNCALLNMPPNWNGQICQGDIDYLMQVAERLGRRRIWKGTEK